MGKEIITPTVTCPRCLFEFFPVIANSRKHEDSVYAHDCVSGYIRPYTQRLCSACKPLGYKDGTAVMSLSSICKINRSRKTRYFKRLEREKLGEDKALDLELAEPVTQEEEPFVPEIVVDESELQSGFQFRDVE